MSYSDKIKDVIDGADVALFMKGTPQFVMCGNSDRALQALRRAGASVTTVDVLADPQIRQDLSALSGWPTIPQVFVKGELVGGADIVEELEQSGELEQTLRDRLGDDYAASSDRADDLATKGLLSAARGPPSNEAWCPPPRPHRAGSGSDSPPSFAGASSLFVFGALPACFTAIFLHLLATGLSPVRLPDVLAERARRARRPVAVPGIVAGRRAPRHVPALRLSGARSDRDGAVSLDPLRRRERVVGRARDRGVDHGAAPARRSGLALLRRGLRLAVRVVVADQRCDLAA